MPTVVTVEVTGQDIAHGNPWCGVECPIYLAARRVLLVSVVGTRSIVIWTDATCLASHTFLLPDAVVFFIESFDDGELVAPFSFPLEIPDCLSSSILANQPEAEPVAA